MKLITKYLPQDLRQALEIRAILPPEDRALFHPPRWITSRKEAFLWAAAIERQDRPIFFLVGGLAFVAMLARLAWQGLRMILGF